MQLCSFQLKVYWINFEAAIQLSKCAQILAWTLPNMLQSNYHCLVHFLELAQQNKKGLAYIYHIFNYILILCRLLNSHLCWAEVDILWIYFGYIGKHLRLLFAAVNIAPNGLIPPFLLSHFCNDCQWHPQFESTLPLQERQNLKTKLSNS